MLTNGVNTKPPVLKLPELDPPKGVGARFISHALKWTILILIGLAGLILAVASVVRIDMTIDANGMLEPNTIWPLRAEESGILREIFVNTGDTLHVGQVVAVIDSLQLYNSLVRLQAELATGRLDIQRRQAAWVIERRQQQQQIEQVRARLSKAHAALRAQLAAHNIKTPPDSILSSYPLGHHVGIDNAAAEVIASEVNFQHAQEQFDVLQLEEIALQQQRLELQQVENEIQIHKRRLRRVRITSPVAGVVLTEDLDKRVHSFIREGDLLCEVSDPEAWKVNLYVTDREIHQVHLGDSARVEVSALSSAGYYQMLRGSVVRIAAEPDGAANLAGRYRVVVQLDQKQIKQFGPQRLKRGYSARGKISTRSGSIIALLWQYLRKKLSPS